MDEQVLFPCNSLVSVNKVTRALKKEQNSLFNCLNSVLHDAVFVREVQALYPGVPLLANLRCGLWYHAAPDDVCYFKSTDGHNGYWSFSTTRLNWNVAEAAAAAGALVIIDATRKGKTFPDSLTKTLPIWAAVINRAVAHVHARTSASKLTTAADTCCRNPPGTNPSSVNHIDADPCFLQPSTTNCPPCSSSCRRLSGSSEQHLSCPACHNSSLPLTDIQPLLDPTCTACLFDTMRFADHVQHATEQGSPAVRDTGTGISQNSTAAHTLGCGCGYRHCKRCSSSCRMSPAHTLVQQRPAQPDHAVPPELTPCLADRQGLDAVGRSFSDTSSSPPFSVGLNDHPQTVGSAVPKAACTAPAVECSSHEASMTGISTADVGKANGGVAPWDTALHLPLHIGRNERVQIEERLEGFVDDLFALGADVEGLAKVLHKPLRPLWISQASHIWVDQVAQPSTLPFTPLILVSVSEPQLYARKCCLAAVLHADSGDTLNGSSSWSYVYVPGAGDDEESWAEGLTPQLFWRHHQEILQAGPACISACVAGLLLAEKAQLSSMAWVPPLSDNTGSVMHRPGGSCNAGLDSTDRSHGPTNIQAACSTSRSMTLRSSGGAVQNSISTGGSSRSSSPVPLPLTDVHHPAPAGCSGGSGQVHHCGQGIYRLGQTGIHLGAGAAGVAPGVWQHVEAVLDVSLQPHPSMALELRWQPASRLRCCSDGFTSKERCSMCSDVQNKACNGDSAAGTPACIGVSTGGAVGDHCKPHARYAWLPVQHAKVERKSLASVLPQALAFLSPHLAAGRRVLVHDASGHDTCVCIAVALFQSLYGIHQPFATDAHKQESHNAQKELLEGSVTKNHMRQHLAYISSCYPAARPAKGMLRQVYGMFIVNPT